MRAFAILTLCALFFGCSDESRPVFGTGAWRFSDISAISNMCSELDSNRIITGEHGDETPEGGTLIVQCSAIELGSGALSIRLVLDGQAGDSIDIRDLRIAAEDASSSGLVETVPTQCESILFEIDEAQYQAVCTTAAPEEGECQLLGATLDRSASSVSLEFACHAVPNSGGSSICEVGGAGSPNAVLSFDGCSGL
jgi:hypothetical protein